MPQKKLPPAAFHLTAFMVVAVWGMTFVSTKLLIQQGLGPTQIFAIRTIMAYICIWPFTQKLMGDTLRDELKLAALGLTAGTLYFFTENTALQLSYANNVAFLVCTSSLMVALLNLRLQKERVNRRMLFAGSLIALVGVAVIIYNGNFVLHLNPVGDLLALAAALSWAVASFFMKDLAGRYPLAFVNRKMFAYGLLFALPLLWMKGEQHIEWQLLARPVVLTNIVFLGVVASWLCFLLWTLAVNRIGAVKTSNYIYAEPLFTYIFSMTILDEPFTSLAAAGAVLILAGLYLSNKN